MKITRNILIIVLLALYFFSCTSDQCVSDTESFLTLEVNVVDTNLIKINFLDSMSAYTPSWNDSIHYSEEGENNSLLLTLSPDYDSTLYIITSKPEAKTDTLIFFHEKEIRFLSPECGFAYNFSIDTTNFKYTKNLIDSVEFINNELTTDEDGYLKIYL